MATIEHLRDEWQECPNCGEIVLPSDKRCLACQIDLIKNPPKKMYPTDGGDHD